jgi:allophanate hydrolase
MVYNNRFFDCMPVFARTVDDGYSVLDCIRGYDRHDSFSRPDADSISLAMPGKTSFRFALPRPEQLEFFGDIQAQAAFSKAVSQLEAIGGIPCEFDFSNFIEAAKLPFDSGLLAERTISYGQILANKPETVHPAVAAMLRKGLSYSAADVVQAIYQMRDLRREVEQQFASVDILVTPTVGRAYTCDELENNPIEFNHNIGYYTYAVSPLDLCALALPSSIRPDGIPFGIQLIALAGHDGALHEVGRRYQHLVKLPPGIEAKTLSNLPAPSHA